MVYVKGGMTMKHRIMSVQDVATYLGLHKDTIYELVRENKLPHAKVGGRILFLAHVLEKWMEDHMTNQ